MDDGSWSPAGRREPQGPNDLSELKRLLWHPREIRGRFSPPWGEAPRAEPETPTPPQLGSPSKWPPSGSQRIGPLPPGAPDSMIPSPFLSALRHSSRSLRPSNVTGEGDGGPREHAHAAGRGEGSRSRHFLYCAGRRPAPNQSRRRLPLPPPAVHPPPSRLTLAVSGPEFLSNNGA